MSRSRRDFLKFIVAGSVAAGCPIDLALLAEPAEGKSEVDGENYEVCHQVRDDHQFPLPAVSKRHDVVIVGGGLSGLSVAYLLRSHDFLLLEKEPHWGGNAYLEEYQGQAFATGAAFEYAGAAADQLAKEVGLTLLPINSPDPTIVRGKWVPDTWREGLDQLPFPADVRESFKKFRRDMLAIDYKRNAQKYDNEPWSQYCAGYAPEIQEWWDAYGASNYGARSSETAAWVALDELHDIAGEDRLDNERVTLSGGMGTLTKRLAEILQPKHGEGMQSGATVVAVEQQKDEVRVSYVQADQVTTAAAKAVIMTAPKLIASRIVAGLSDEQRDAMQQIRYIPYAVVNMIFDKPVYNRAFDTWCPGISFTDMVVADWTLRSQPGYHAKNNILTFYAPIPERDRFKLQTLDNCKRIAANVLRDFQNLLPEFKADPIEVHLYRRGHPMFISAPGMFTKIIPLASKPTERIFFANTDSVGPESEASGAITAARRASEWAEKILAGKSAAQAIAATGIPT